jgi:hypothetical protein
MGAGRNSQKKRTVGKAVKPEAGYRVFTGGVQFEINSQGA